MKHPCMAMCWATNGTVIGQGMRSGRSPQGWGGGGGEGVRRVKDWSQSLVIWLFQQHIISNIPRI